MTHTQLTTSEAALIHGYLLSGIPITKISHLTGRSRPTIYRVKHWIDAGKSISDWAQHCHDMRHHRGRHSIHLSEDCVLRIKQFCPMGGIALTLSLSEERCLSRYCRGKENAEATITVRSAVV